MNKPAQILANVFTAKNVCDTNDCLYALQTILERAGADWTAHKSVFARVVAIGKKYVAFKASEGRDFIYTGGNHFNVDRLEQMLTNAGLSVPAHPERKALKAGDSLTVLHQDGEPLKLTVDSVDGYNAHLSNGERCGAELQPCSSKSGIWFTVLLLNKQALVLGLDSTMKQPVEPGVSVPMPEGSAAALASKAYDTAAPFGGIIVRIGPGVFKAIWEAAVSEGWKPQQSHIYESGRCIRFPSGLAGTWFRLERGRDNNGQWHEPQLSGILDPGRGHFKFMPPTLNALKNA